MGEEELDKAVKELIDAGVSDDEIESFIKDYSKGNAAPSSPVPAGLPEAGDVFGQSQEPSFVGSMVNAARRGIGMGQQANVLTALQGDYSPDAAKELATIQQEQKNLPTSKGYQEFNQAPGFSAALGKIFSTDGPQLIAELSVESLAALITAGATRIGLGAGTGAAMGSVIPGLGTLAGAGAGTIAGVGLASTNLEHAGSIMESLQESGVDTTDPNSIAKAFSDPEYLSKIRQKALLKGVPIGIFDMASAGIAGRIAKAVGVKTLGKKLLGSVLEMSAQGALGGGGELAGELAAGEKISAPGILGEMVGEFGPGSVETAVGTAYHGAKKVVAPRSDISGTGVNEADYDVEIPNPQINHTLDVEAQLQAKEFEKILEDMDVDLTEGHPAPLSKEEEGVDAIIKKVVPEASNEPVGGGVVNNPKYSVDVLPNEDEKWTAHVSQRNNASNTGYLYNEALSTTFDTKEEALAYAEQIKERNNKEGAPVSPKIEAPVEAKAEAPQPVYRTSQNEMTNPAKYGEPERGGIMHTWQKGNNTSVGIFTVKPSMTGEIKPSNREDLVVAQGLAEEAHPAFKAKDFGNKTTKIGLKRKPNLLKTRDSGMEMHTDTIIEAAQKSPAVNQDAFTIFLDKVKALPDDRKQTAVAAFLRTKAGGEFDGITYRNKAETTKTSKAPKTINKSIGIAAPVTVNESLSGRDIEKENREYAIEKAQKEKERKAAERAEKKEKRETKEPKPEKVKKEPKMITYKGVTKSLEVWKGVFYKKIGSAQTDYQRDLYVAKYNEFREKSGLKPVDAKRVAQIAKSEAAVKGGPKLLEEERRQATRDTHKANEMGMTLDEWRQHRNNAREYIASSQKLTPEQRREAIEDFGLTAKEVDEASADRNTAKADAIRDIEKGMDLPEGSIEDVDFMGEKSMGETLEEKLIAENIFKYPKKEITFEEYKALAPKSQNNILNGIFRVIAKYKGKEGSGTKFIQITVPRKVNPSFGGFHFSLTKSDNSYIVVLVDEKTGRPVSESAGSNTVLHEYLHDYTKMMFHRLYKSNKNFKEHITKAFDKIVKTVNSKTEAMLYKEITGQNLSMDDTDLLVMISTIVPFKGVESANGIMSRINLARNNFKGIKGSNAVAKNTARLISEDIYRDFYAFANVHEMMSEVFSDPNTMMFLSRIKMDEEISKGINKGSKKSLLYKWYEDLFSWVQKQFAHFELGEVRGNALEYFMDIIGGFDEEFILGDLARQADPGMFGFLTPEEVKTLEENIDSFNFNRIRKAAVKANREIANKITYTLEPRKEIKSVQDVKDYVSRVNGHLPANKKLDVDSYGRNIWRKIQRIKKQRSEAKLHQAKLVTNAKNRPEYKSSWKFRDDVDDFARVRIDDLSAKQSNNEIIDYITGLGMLSLNGVVSQRAYNVMINYGKKLQMLQDLLPIAKKLNQNFMGGLEKWANPATFASIVAKYNTPAANKLMKSIYGGSMKSMARASMESTRFFQELSSLAEKYNFTHKDLALIGMYGGIFSTVSQPNTAEWEREVLSNAKATVSSAKNKLQAFADKNYKGDLKEKYIKNEIAIAEKLLASLEKSVTSNVLSKEQQKYLNTIRGFAATHEADFERNSVAMWGNKDYQRRWNYFPTLAQGSIEKGGDLRTSELLRGEADNLFEALSTDGKKGTYGYIYGKKVWSNYRRTNPKGYFYENDALAIARRWSKSMLYDLYASKELKTINRVLENSEFKQVYKTKIREAFKKHLKSISGASNKFDAEVGAAASKLLKTRDKLYTAALATSGQILLQSSSGFAAAAVMSVHLNPVTAVSSFSKAIRAAMGSLASTSKFQKFLEEEGLGIQLRDILFEKYLTADDYQNYLLGIKAKGLTNKIENVSEWSLRAGDKLGARLVWFAAYFNAGGTFENPSKAAVLEAERVTGVMQNMSDMSFSAPAFKYNSTAQKILMGMFMAFKSFSINAALNTSYSTRYAFNSREAREVLAGQLGSIIAYHTLSVMAIRPLYKAVTSAVIKAFGGDDDDEDKDKKRVGDFETILSESLWEIMMGGLTTLTPYAASSPVDALLRYLYNEGPAKTIHGSPYDEFDKYADSPIYSAKDQSALYRDMLEGGPGFKEMTETAVDLSTLLVEQAYADQFMEELQKADTRNAKWEELLLRSFGTLFGGIAGVPLRGDIKRILDAVAKKKRSQRAQQKTTGGASGEEPAYQFQEYNLNNSDLK